ncbi:MAG: universal stress protein [Syntrophobacterales bacterium]|jgi:nucleotide-binding universal stress UspA family protein
MKHGKLLIAMDGSPNSKDAVKYVTQICAPNSFKVTLLHVMPTAPVTFWDMSKDEFFKKKMKEKYDQWRDNAKEIAQIFLGEAKNDFVRAKFREHNVDIMLRERRIGIARDILTEVAHGYDALVMGRRGLSKVGTSFLGSTSERIVEKIEDVPVWVVGKVTHAKSMLLAVDGSDNSDRAIDYFGTLFAAAEFRATLFHVIRSFGLGFLEGSTLREEAVDGFVEEAKSNIPRMFQRYRKCLKEYGIESARISTVYLMQSHSRAGSILEEAAAGGYGTIVMGRRGLSELHEFSMGRVTKKVLNGAGEFTVWLVP